MAQTSVRENTVPQGGAVNPVAQASGLLLPDTPILKQAAQVFHEQSEQNYLVLDTQNLTPGNQTMIKLQNVGLGESVEFWIEGTIKAVNAEAATKDINLPYEFPFNLIANIQTMFNGKVALNNLDGFQLLALMLKRQPKSDFARAFRNSGTRIDTTNTGGQSPGNNLTLSEKLAYIYSQDKTKATLTAGEGLTGVNNITIAASQTGYINFGFYLRLPFVLREDLPLGLIPMQNNSIYATVTFLVNTINNFIQNVDTVNVTVTLENVKITPVYNFWAIPADVRVYQFFVNNSYILSSYPKNAITSTGSKALKFNFPNNYWLLAALFTIRNTSGVLQDIYSVIENPHLVYNGTITVDLSPIKARVAREFYDYGREMPKGILLFDGTMGVDRDVNNTDTSKWLNMYQANNPVYYADCSVQGEFDVLLEQIVPNYVKIV